VIRPLFLDSLRAEFDGIRNDRSARRASRLEEFRVRLTRLRFLDPACGCGNFLVIAYRELRKLEVEVLQAQHSGQQAFTLDEVSRLSQVDVHQFYEIEEWPARIAEVALWLMDHQANLRILEAFSQPFLRLPLRNSPHIHHGNALRLDWNDLLPASECSYILGNPPFVGKAYMSVEQKDDVCAVMRQVGGVPGGGVLDFVAAWYLRAATYTIGKNIQSAFVSTSSLSQGEQPGALWRVLMERFKLRINFAYRSFQWESEARGKAHVHVVIIGFGPEKANKWLYVEENEQLKALPASNISPYLTISSNLTIMPRTNPICDVPTAVYGSKPVDGSKPEKGGKASGSKGLVLSSAEYKAVLAKEPELKRLIRPFIGADEFLYGTERWCFWLIGVSPKVLSESSELRARLQHVKDFRIKSKKKPTQEAAAVPSLFAEIRQPDETYLAIPEVSSENRNYIPMAFLPPTVICSNKMQMFPGATKFHFGVLTSRMHMAWMGQVCGRLESRFDYSSSLVYNNFPWPSGLRDTQIARIEALAQAVLDTRILFPDSSLASLYDPLLMPAALLKAHQTLDRAVDRAYRPDPFQDDQARVEHLFSLYERLTAPLLPPSSKIRRNSRRTNSAVSGG